MELMPDARHLWAKIFHLDPVILTALPRENGERVDNQKRNWVKRNRLQHRRRPRHHLSDQGQAEVLQAG
jgi:hypothetical protein